jgi:hypothetical protein
MTKMYESLKAKVIYIAVNVLADGRPLCCYSVLTFALLRPVPDHRPATNMEITIKRNYIGF